MAENYPPYCYEHDGKPTGFFVDIFRLLESRMDMKKNEIHFLPWARSYKRLLNGTGDVLFPMGMTPQRHEQFKFVGPVFWNTVYFYRKKGSKIDIGSIEDAKKTRRIAVTRDDLYYYKLVNKGFTNLDLSAGHEYDFLKVLKGRAALTPMGDITYFPFMKKHSDLNADDYEKIGPPIFLTTTYLAFALKTPDFVIKKWQRALDEVMQDGTWQLIMDKYFPISK
ncbi:substrate-binding periplasmic protein [Maridesulfovibrio zosterae]|uniref:substrate-binding periplasmic protein n=1 Tax=Maridesulfovibrio zosterae TaxID=82171 RepID=UPI001FE014A4|nr:transporter substrate-binding domain-containing protein [Maridesulfovibrio zosterae]